MSSKSQMIRLKLLDGKHHINFFFNAFGMSSPHDYNVELLEKNYSILLNIALSENDIVLSNMLSWLRDFIKLGCSKTDVIESKILNSLFVSGLEVSYQSLKQIVETTKERNLQPVRPKPDLTKYKHMSVGKDVANQVTAIDIKSSPNKYRKYFSYDRLDNIVLVDSNSSMLAIQKSEDLCEDTGYFFLSEHDKQAKLGSDLRSVNRARKEAGIRKSIHLCKQYLSQFNMCQGDILLTDKVTIIKIDTRYEVTYRFKGKRYKELFEVPICADGECIGMQTQTTFETLTGAHNVYVVGVVQNEL